jgi:D-alanyl-D-alanine carboxypeptidase
MRLFIALALLCAISLPAGAGSPAFDAEQAFRDELGRSLDNGLPGITVALATRQGVVWTGSAGYANVETRAPAHPGYLYGIGSITKVFVACVIQQLADEGRLNLDATPRDILGEAVTGDIPNAGQATLRQLLNHTSGIPTWEFDPDWIRRGRGADLLTDRPWRKDEPLEYIRHGRHLATNRPGAAYAYSNSNYTLLGLVIEKITGHEAVREIHARVLDPLGLTDIRLEGFEPADANRIPARYHFDTPEFRRDAGLHPSFRPVAPGLIDVSGSNLSTEWTAGGLLATARDLAVFARALRDGAVVGPRALGRMMGFTPTRDDADPGSEVGEGLFREKLETGTLIGEDGGVLGFGAVMGWLEHEDLVIVVMTNVGSMHSGDAAYYPLKLVKSARFIAAARRLGVALSPPRPAPPAAPLMRPPGAATAAPP